MRELVARGKSQEFERVQYRQVLQAKVLNLNDVIAGMRQELQPVIGEDVELRILPEPEVGQLKADPNQTSVWVPSAGSRRTDAPWRLIFFVSATSRRETFPLALQALPPQHRRD